VQVITSASRVGSSSEANGSSRKMISGTMAKARARAGALGLHRRTASGLSAGKVADAELLEVFFLQCC